MLSVEKLCFTYSGDEQDTAYEMFHDLSFTIQAGEFVSVVGASGCGKSTLFRILNQLETPDSGEIRMDGACAYMPQKDMLFPWRKAWENVALPLEMQGVGRKERRERSLELLESVGLLEWAEKYPREFSGGMRQRVAFARTLCTGADTLLLDEPFSALDYMTRIGLQQWLLEQWTQWNKTIVFVTHDVEEALYLSERVLVMQGRPVKSLAEYVVPIEGLRTRECLNTQEMIRLKEQLIHRIMQQEDKGGIVHED